MLVIWSVLFVERVLKVDDPVGAISVHGVCGAFGCLAIGSIAWGQVASATTTATALLIASGGLLLGCVSAVRFRLATAGALYERLTLMQLD